MYSHFFKHQIFCTTKNVNTSL